MKKFHLCLRVYRVCPYCKVIQSIFLILMFQGRFWQGVAENGHDVSQTEAPLLPYWASNSKMQVNDSRGSSQSPESSLSPASPFIPALPNGSIPQQREGLCNLNVSAIERIVRRTAGDCTAPLAKYVGNVICCPQFTSMLWIMGGMYSLRSDHLAFHDNEAVECLADIMNFMVENGGNATTTELCNAQPSNLTHGMCPVLNVKAFEEVVNTSKLLSACSTVDPLQECCNAVCQPAITDAAIRLASHGSGLEPTLDMTSQEQVIKDCEGVVFTWLARELGAEAANKAFRILSNCKVNQVCPLTFKDTSSVVKACNGPSPDKSTCCTALTTYISFMQQQMLITNVQALECVTVFGAKLKQEGIIVDLYNICKIDLKDFSLQVYGNQGCLLRSIPSDIIYDNVSGISFRCDLNDNIPAPWPSSASLTSFPLCANRESLPALPVLDTSKGLGMQTDFEFRYNICDNP
ncbi:hypothetical protein KP509_23G053300 [Ceratopteris richardii]|uniref:SPARK domain-containing protein n=1 Tax=Ceratopteris richardii TaxID=49495 RepID=A0A8T2S2B2_CERRI|nr:hypothetical protein KP509_23G053300 [Ceratopteris richardii]